MHKNHNSALDIFWSYFPLIICNDIGNSSHLLDDLRMKSSGLQLEKFVLNLMHSQLFHRLMKFASDKFHVLTLKAPITTAADDKFCDILPNF